MSTVFGAPAGSRTYLPWIVLSWLAFLSLALCGCGKRSSSSLVGNWNCGETHYVFKSDGKGSIPQRADSNGATYFDRATKEVLVTYELSGETLTLHSYGMKIAFAPQDYGAIPIMLNAGNAAQVSPGIVQTPSDVIMMLKVSNVGGQMALQLTKIISQGVDKTPPGVTSAPQSCQRDL